MQRSCSLCLIRGVEPWLERAEDEDADECW
jgi:hypothetical protein